MIINPIAFIADDELVAAQGMEATNGKSWLIFDGGAEARTFIDPKIIFRHK